MEREHRGRGREAERTEEEESRDRQERKEDSRRKGRTDVFERGGGRLSIAVRPTSE